GAVLRRLVPGAGDGAPGPAAVDRHAAALGVRGQRPRHRPERLLRGQLLPHRPVAGDAVRRHVLAGDLAELGDPRRDRGAVLHGHRAGPAGEDAVMRGPVTFGGTARAALPLAVLAFLVNGTVVAVALQAVGVPGDHPMIDFPALLPASIGPVVGSAEGLALSYRRPGRLTFLGFVTPAVVISAVFGWRAAADFAEHDDLGLLVAALLGADLPTASAIVGLRRLTPRGPARAPSAADATGAARTRIWEV